MYGVASKVAQKIGVLFQHQNINTRAGKQRTKHHAGRPSAHHAATYVNLFHKASLFPPGSLKWSASQNRSGRDRVPDCIEAVMPFTATPGPSVRQLRLIDGSRYDAAIPETVHRLAGGRVGDPPRRTVFNPSERGKPAPAKHRLYLYRPGPSKSKTF